MPAAAATRAEAPAAAGVRVRVTLTPQHVRALAEAVARGDPVVLEARVLDIDSARDSPFTSADVITIELAGRDRTSEAVDGADAEGSERQDVEPLTAREREVLELVAEGMSNRAIAERLAISEHTVKFHVGSLLGKLAAGTRAELVAIAVRRGLIML
jgi:DNA-binding CsgD family transcriptional regulator